MRQNLALLSFLLFFLFFSCNQPSPLIQELRDQKKVQSAYFLYPSTLRMLNFQDDPAINKLVKDVDKLSLMLLNADSFNYESIVDLSTKLQQQEQYEVYLEVEDESRQIYVLGKEANNKTLALGMLEEAYYLVDIQGQLNLLALPEAIQNLSQLDSAASVGGIPILLDLMTKDINREKRRKERLRKREERRKEKAAKEQMVRDSLRQDSLLEIKD